jgi:hypothetical protein
LARRATREESRRLQRCQNPIGISSNIATANLMGNQATYFQFIHIHIHIHIEFRFKLIFEKWLVVKRFASD